MQGSYPSPDSISFMLKLGVTHLLNLDTPYPDRSMFEEQGVCVHEHFIPDMCPMNQKDAESIVQIIHDSLRKPGSKIYVHCNAGINRSPTCVWLYLIASGLREEEAREQMLGANKQLVVPDTLLTMDLDLSCIKKCIDTT